MDEKSILNNLDKTVLAGMKLNAFNNLKGQKLLILYNQGITDPFVVSCINNIVAKALRREIFRRLPFKQPHLYQGDFIVGADEHGNPIKAFIQYLNAGTLIVANTGAGKTTLIIFYAVQIAPHVRGMWLIDLRKKEFRFLRKHLAKQGIDLIIIRGRQFRINPLQVPSGVDPNEYASVIADLLVKVLNLPPRASVLLKSTIIKLYRKYGIFNGSEMYPTLFHLFEAIRCNKHANPQARLAILDNLEAVLLALGPQVLGYHKGWDIGELAQLHLVFELTGSPETVQDLLQNCPIASELCSRLARGVSNRGMDLWISFDEGQRVFSQRKESSGYHGNTITDMAGLVRGAGIGLSISVLSPDNLSGRIPSITSTKIIGRCGSVPDYKSAGSSMGLTQEQISWCTHNLKPGLFVGQVGEGNWRYPFLFKVPELKRDHLQPVTDQEADDSLKPLESLTVIPATEFSNWSGVENIELKNDSHGKKYGDLSPSEFKFILAVVEHPMCPSSEYAKLAGIGPNTVQRIRPVLIEKGFIKEHKLNTGNRGRSTILIEPLELAKQTVTDYKE
ncbi:hypothetical protein ACFL3G_02650 [Planctomycetota bacterium]